MTHNELFHTICQRLLEKYDEGKKPRLHISENVFAPYRDNNPIGITYAFNELVKTYSQELIIEWLPNQVAIQTIKLKNPHTIAQLISYQFLNTRLTEATKELDRSLKDNPVYHQLRDQLINQWAHNHTFLRWHIDDYPMIISYFKAAYQILQDYENGIENDFRHFSVKVFGDSKTFSAIKTGVVNLLKILNQELELLSTENILKYYGLTPIPHPVLLSGHISLSTADDTICANFPSYIGIDTEHIKYITVDPSVRMITTIENQATFHRYVKTERYKDEVVLFTSGIPSPSFLNLLRLIAHHNPALSFRHWGDIDLGGFIILNILDQSIQQSVNAYRMLPTDYPNHQNDSYLTNSEIKRLQNLKLSVQNQKVMLQCIQSTKKFEQEAFY